MKEKLDAMVAWCNTIPPDKKAVMIVPNGMWRDSLKRALADAGWYVSHQGATHPITNASVRWWEMTRGADGLLGMRVDMVNEDHILTTMAEYQRLRDVLSTIVRK